MEILGIETSCDETAAAIIETKKGDSCVKILSNVVTSSLPLHAKTGGIIPETAARQQVKYIIPVIEKVLRESNLYLPASIRQLADHLPSSTIHCPDIDAIAVTIGPGLIGSLLVGVETAKTLAYVWNKPIIPVNHLIGHIYANWIICHPELVRCHSGLDPESPKERNEMLNQVQHDKEKVRNDKIIEFPALALIVSGGHTDLVLMKNHGQIAWLGGTRDDAAGEAFDKIGRLLGLPYPGGPAIEQAAKTGNPKSFNFPRPLIGSDDFDFSFSGLKTAVFRKVSSIKYPFGPSLGRGQVLSEETKANLAASIQAAIIDVLVKKTIKAAKKYGVKSILLSGGVAANQNLREEFILNTKLFAPPKSLCTDNGAMIASAAFFNYKEVPWQKITANPELYFY